MSILRRLIGDFNRLRGPTHIDSISTDRINGTVYAVAGERSLQEAINSVPWGSNGEFPSIALKEVKAVPTAGGPAFENIDYGAAVDGDGDAPSGLTVEGTSMQASTPIIGTGDHAVIMSTNDPFLGRLSIRQNDDTGNYDAIHISEREAKVYDVGSDGAPRNNVRVDSHYAQLHNLELAGAGDYALYITSSGTDTQVTNLQVKSPMCEKGVYLNGGNSQITNAVVEDVNGVGFRLGGGANVSTVANTIVQEPAGNGLEVASSTTHVNVHMTVYGAGNHGAEIAGSHGNYNLSIYSSTGDDLYVTGDNNTIHVVGDGSVTLASGAENNTLIGRVGGTVTDNGTGNDTSGLS